MQLRKTAFQRIPHWPFTALFVVLWSLMHGLVFLVKLPYKQKTWDRRLPLPPSAVLSQQAGSITPAYTTLTWGVTASSPDVQNTPCCRACPPLQQLPATLTRLQVSFLLGRTRDDTSLPTGGSLTPVPPESYRALKDLSARRVAATPAHPGDLSVQNPYFRYPVVTLKSHFSTLLRWWVHKWTKRGCHKALTVQEILAMHTY